MISAEDFLKSNPIRLPAFGETEFSTLTQDGAGGNRGHGGHAKKRGPTASGGNLPKWRSCEGGSGEESGLPSSFGMSDTWVEDASLPGGDRSGSNADDDSVVGRAGDEARCSRSRTRRRHRYQVRVPRAGGFGAGGLATPDAHPEADNVDACREAALTLLDAAARSSEALAQRLARKGFNAPTIEQVVARLTQLGLLDDRRYAQDLLRACLHRTMGERGVLNEMTRKGLTRPLSEEVIAQAAEEGLFVDSAYELGRKVAKRTEGLDLQVRKRRLWSAGSRKGHNPSLLTQVANDLLVESD